MTVWRYQIRKGLQDIRGLVNGTHWIQSTYVTVKYEGGDGVYEDGSIVKNTKVVGCLVGLSRLVGAKAPTYYKGKDNPFRDGDVPRQTALSQLLEDAMQQTIRDEFIDGYFDEDADNEPPDDLSIEGWNDADVRTKEDVIAMLDRAIERA